MTPTISFLQAIILAIVQGVTELFPISSLGHSVLIANLFDWHNVLKGQTANASSFLAFLVALHVATAIALIVFYRAEWLRIVRGFVRSVPKLRHDHRLPAHDSDAKLAWLLIAATIPAGLIGVAFEHALRTQFAKPLFAIIFITLNGVLLIRGDTYVRAAQINRPRQRRHIDASELTLTKTSRMVSDHLTFGRAIAIGIAQIGALLAGISRSGITMVAGVRSGLNHQDAARFSFLLATPIILAAGVYKLPDLFSSPGNKILPQALIGAAVAGIAAYYTIRYLDKYFQNKSLRPFGIYCICAGVFMLLLGIWRGHF